jgi:hypothetical protein
MMVACIEQRIEQEESRLLLKGKSTWKGSQSISRFGRNTA